MTNTKSGKAAILVLLACILITGVVLRARGIDWGLPHEGYYFSYKSDENIYIRTIGGFDPSRLDFNPHFFYWGAWHFYELAAALKVADLAGFIQAVPEKSYYREHPEELAKIYLTGRYLSVLYSVLTVVLVFFIGRRFCSSAVGLLAACILALMPAHVVNSHYLKADAAVTFWIALGLLASGLVMTRGKLWHYIFAGFALGMAAGTQFNGMPFAHAILLAHFFQTEESYRFKVLVKKALSGKLLAGYATIVLTYLATNPYVVLAYNEARPVLIELFTRPSITNAEPRSDLVLDTLRIFAVGLTWPWVILALVSILSLLLFRKRFTLLLFSFALPCLGYMVIQGNLATRLQMILFPALCILMAQVIVNLAMAKPVRRSSVLRSVLIGIAVACASYVLCYTWSYLEVFKAEPRQDTASEWMLETIPPGSIIGTIEQPYIEKSPTVVHQDYFYKETDSWTGTYHVTVIGEDSSELSAVNPDVFILSVRDGFLGPQGYADNMGESKKALFAALTRDYRVMKSFGMRQTLWGVDITPKKTVLSDWHLPLYDIHILKRNDSEKH
ncbi:ArnT family glycosyltransferase [Acidobacteriota bacterium]